MRLDDEVKDWKQNERVADSLKYSVVLVGDGGNASLENTMYLFEYLKLHLNALDEQSSIVFLGDNIYPVGMAPDDGSEERIDNENRLNAQLEALYSYQGNSYFIPGNHDWYRYGSAGVERQEMYIEDELLKNRPSQHQQLVTTVFAPDGACGDPIVIELFENTNMLLLDTQWWLRFSEDEEYLYRNCEVSNREQFLEKLNEIAEESDADHWVIALHHPIYTNGHHGGKHKFLEYIFPLIPLKKKLFVPLPFQGGLATHMRSFVSNQDTPNPEYRELKSILLDFAAKQERAIFASGHEHNLQYFKKEDRHFIVSGSASKTSHVRMGNDAKFVFGEKGFAQLDFYNSGHVYLSFFIPAKDGKTAEKVFEWNLYAEYP